LQLAYYRGCGIHTQNDTNGVIELKNELMRSEAIAKCKQLGLRLMSKFIIKYVNYATTLGYPWEGNKNLFKL